MYFYKAIKNGFMSLRTECEVISPFRLLRCARYNADDVYKYNKNAFQLIGCVLILCQTF